MSEPITHFVARRRPDWESLKTLLAQQKANKLALADLNRLDQLYRRASADLARAQAAWPGSEAHRYLNELCADAYGAIHQPPRERVKRIRAFFRAEFPRTLRANLGYVAASAFLFLLGGLVGALVVVLEPRGAELLVPQHLRDYVAQKRMWTDDLFSVMPPGVAASAIATNNLTVTISAFALGLSMGLGTVFILLNNGVHLGSIAALCTREGMGFDLLAFVAAHGFVELSIIVIAGGAGLMLGHALVDPGELPRSQALRRNGQQAVRLVVGCAPFLLGIGFVEGYVSPGDLFPAWAKIALGLSLGAAFWLYLLRGGRTVDSAGELAGSVVERRRS